MIHNDVSEAAVVSEPLQIGAAPAEREQAAGPEPAPDRRSGTDRRKQRRR
jgi:hypothetical protein